MLKNDLKEIRTKTGTLYNLIEAGQYRVCAVRGLHNILIICLLLMYDLILNFK